MCERVDLLRYLRRCDFTTTKDFLRVGTDGTDDEDVDVDEDDDEMRRQPQRA